MITCPTSECTQQLEHHDVKRLAELEVFERFDTFSLREALRQMLEFRWCKSAGCGSGQIHFEGDEAPIMTCEACQKKSCYTHDIPWHEEMTCSEYDEMMKYAEAETATQEYLKRETKPCPKCGVHITKDGGCNHMSCKVSTCKYEFCWL
ncbi:11735_t:CDS:2 [Ambispora gerdemannii]|uniref:RBR-type E3 ubiquitin transferase n=1 Tax=Ambispora gerdemannii TaxID=144530 RepID=A0A9N9A7B9_9GLOM|nr:11735_t:CDS:2 [Ambispora gerdemannii]